MAIVPGVEPVQGLDQRVKPFQPLPVEQIGGAARRMTKRYRQGQSALAELRNQMAQQEVLPENQQAFNLATEGVRQRIKSLAESGDLHNKIPQVRREARRFAKISTGFKQNRKAIQESLKSLEEAEGLTESQRAIERRKIMRNAGVVLQDDGTVDPSSISSSRSIQPGQDPKEFLSERLSKVQPETRRSRSAQDGVIRKTEQDALTMQRLRQQGFRELGFAAQRDEDGNLNLQKVSSANPKVDRWLSRQQEVIASQISRQVDPQENPEKYRQKVNQALEDQVINMVNTVASRFKEVDDPETTIKSDPRVDDSDSSGGSTTDIGIATVGAPFSAKDEQTKKTEQVLRNEQRRQLFRKNDNINQSTYSEIESQLENVSNFEGNVMGGGVTGERSDQVSPREQRLQALREKYGDATIEAYKTVKEAEKNVSEAVGEQATQERSFEFDTGSKEYNEVERGIATMTPSDFKSEKLNEEQLRYLLRDSNNFQIVDIAQDMGWLRLKAKNTEDMPQNDTSWAPWGRNKPDEGETIVLGLQQESLGPGRGGRSSADRLMEHFPEEAKRFAKYQQRVSGQGFGENWEKVKGTSDVSMRMQVGAEGDFRVGKQPFAQRFEIKVGDNPLTFGRMTEKVINNETDQDNFQRTVNEITRAVKRLPAVRKLEQTGNLPPLSGQQIKGMIMQWHEDKSKLSDSARELMDQVMNSPLPADRRGRGLMWADQFKSYN